MFGAPVASVCASNQITPDFLGHMVESEGVWFPWPNQKLDMGSGLLTLTIRNSSLVNRDQGFQFAMKMLVSPGRFPCRLEAKTSLDPSRENIGNPSKVSLKVTFSNPEPSRLIR